MQNQNSLYSFIGLLLTNRKILILVFVISSFLSVTITLLMPNWYRASTTLVPPKGNDLLSLLNSGSSGSTLQKIAGIGLGGALQNMGSYSYIAILGSRELKEQIITEFDLISSYKMEDEPWEKVLLEFDDHMSYDFNIDGYLSISFEDKDPKKATIITNRIVDLLNTYSIDLATSEALANKIFLENKISNVKDSLIYMENEFETFFKNEEFIFIPDNVNTLDNIAQIYSQKKIKEVEYQLLMNRFESSNNLITQKKQEIEILEKELESIPANLINSIRIYRDYAVLTSLLEYLVPALEQAKLELIKNTPVLLILDEAKIPEYKNRPRRSILCIISVLISLFSALALILIRERIDLNQIRFIKNEYQ